MDKEKKDLLIFGCIWAAIAFVFASGGILKHGATWPQLVKAACAIVFTLTAALNPMAFRLGYGLQMKVAMFIGGIVSTILLSVVFFGVFAPVGILFRLIGKDHLERKLDRTAKTYWHVRGAVEFDKERYKQQF
ncbi:MAG: hypothetical protein HQL16_03880 [Candidatus Omnitrophica bacterium]|nr:hypothetical protein [Candidatus Omnitrophota bacterium]